MDIETLKVVAADLFGNGWQTRLAKALVVDGSTVRRWIANGVEAPSYISAYLETLGDRQETRGALLYMKRAGINVRFSTHEPSTVDHMLKRLSFPGVEQLKPMPAIHAAFDADGKRIVRLDGAVRDEIIDTSTDYTLVRHPDSRHLKGYLKAAAGDARQAAVTTHRFHHYSLLLSEPVIEPRLTHIIATHSGTIRVTDALLTDPEKEVGNYLGDIMEF